LPHCEFCGFEDTVSNAALLKNSAGAKVWEAVIGKKSAQKLMLDSATKMGFADLLDLIYKTINNLSRTGLVHYRALCPNCKTGVLYAQVSNPDLGICTYEIPVIYGQDAVPILQADWYYDGSKASSSF